MKRLRFAAMLGLSGLLVWLLAESAAVRAAAFDALRLCARSVVPALFPFLVVSSLLIALGFGEWAGKHLGWLMGLFRLPGAAGTALVLGLVGGYPIGARTAAELYGAGLLRREEAERLLAFANNSNPVFLLTVLGQGVFHSARAGLALWGIHVLSALAVGLYGSMGTEADPVRRRAASHGAVRTVRFTSALVEAVRGGAAAQVSICGFVVFFYVLSSPLAMCAAPWAAAAVGALELFSVTPLLTPDLTGFVLAAACAGWGGVSVLCQTAASLEGSGLSLLPCVKGKAAQAVLSAAAAAIVWHWL